MKIDKARARATRRARARMKANIIYSRLYIAITKTNKYYYRENSIIYKLLWA